MADFSDWDSQVFGYRVGTHRYTDLPRDLGDVDGLDVVFARGPYRGQLPDPRSTVFEVQVDLRNEGVFLEKHLPLASASDFDKVLRIADATLANHRWGRDLRLSSRARDFYRTWLTSAREREQIHVFRDLHGCVGFVVVERADGDCRLSLIAVDPDHQRREYGDQLVKFFLGQKANTHRVKTWVDNVPAINLYLRNGFRVESVECVEHVWLV